MKKNRFLKAFDIGAVFILITIGIVIPVVIKQPLEIILQIGLILMMIFWIANSRRKQELKLGKVIDQYNLDLKAKERLIHSHEIMLELSNIMLQVSSLNEFLNIILQKAIEVVPVAGRGSILVMNETEMLEFKAIYGFKEDLYKVRLNPRESYQWQATNGNFVKPVLIDNIIDYSKSFMKEENYRIMDNINALNLKSTLSAPILIDGRFFGSINLDSTEADVFDQVDFNLLEYFASQAANAIKNHEIYEKMVYLSKYDGLTKVYNRRYFEEVFEDILAIGERDGRAVSIVLIDLNRFKVINDKYGHSIGDQILIYFAAKFGEMIRKSDLFARYGGDEFIAVFYDSDYKQTMFKLERIHQIISNQTIQHKDLKEKLNCGFSYGIAEYPREGLDYKALFNLADERMYKHKKDKAGNIEK